MLEGDRAGPKRAERQVRDSSRDTVPESIVFLFPYILLEHILQFLPCVTASRIADRPTRM